jgi:hypothetical protein
MSRSVRLELLLAAALVGVGCTGEVGSNPNSPDPTRPAVPGQPNPPGVVTPPNTTPPMPVKPDPTQPGAADQPGVVPLRRLTINEYNNTVRDLLGVSAGATNKAFSRDQESSQSGFVRGAALTTGADARAFLTSASTVSAAMTAKVSSILPCNPVPAAAAAQETCVKQFIEQFGKRAFRRPVAPDEAADLLALYTAQRAPDVGATFEDAVSAVIAGMIQTPYFLYHWELGASPALKDGNLVKLNSWEIASRLSYFLWSTMPDDKLFEAASKGELSTADQIAAQTQRMLADPKAKDAIKNFHNQWLEISDLASLEKDPVLTGFTPELAQSMIDETGEFAAKVLLGSGKIDDLFTSNASFVDANLAKLYGVTATGSGLSPATLPADQRAGLFTQAAWLTSHADASNSHPVKRGVAILQRVACSDVQAPKDLIIPDLPEPKPGQSNRERFAMHGMNPCAACHQLIDPIGFAFEEYDAVGKFRTTESEKPVDSSGQFAMGTSTIKFKNAVEMVKQLVQTTEARTCMTKQWARFFLGRREGDGEAASIASAQDAFAKGGYDVKQLITTLTRSKAFTHRTPAAGEVLQ